MGALASFSNPQSVDVDSAGNVYVADTYNDLIRKVTPDGMVITVGGMAGQASHVDEIGDVARFNQPSGIACNAVGHLYISDSENVICVGEPTHATLSITGQPQGVTSLVGATASFSVSVSGSLPLSFQWFKGGSPLLSATNSGLSLQSLALSDTGNYFCAVTNADGWATSQVARLTVYVLSITHPQGALAGPSSFGMSVDASDTNRLYRLQCKTNLADLEWRSIDPWLTGNGSNMFLYDLGAYNPQTFYRVETMSR
jgi:hypothetical protein